MLVVSVVPASVMFRLYSYSKMNGGFLTTSAGQRTADIDNRLIFASLPKRLSVTGRSKASKATSSVTKSRCLEGKTHHCFVR